MKNIIQILLILLTIQVLKAQNIANEYSIKGYVFDSKTGEPLNGANCTIMGTSLGAATNGNGYFEINRIKKDTVKIRASYIGTAPAVLEVIRKNNQVIIEVYFTLYISNFDDMKRYKEIPPEWQRINANNKFSFSIPDNLQYKVSNNNVLYNKIILSNEMYVQYDYRFNVSYGVKKNYSEISSIIGCKKVSIKMFGNSYDKQFKYTVAADFQGLSFWISFKDKKDEEVALVIVNSIQFQ